MAAGFHTWLLLSATNEVGVMSKSPAHPAKVAHGNGGQDATVMDGSCSVSPTEESSRDAPQLIYLPEAPFLQEAGNSGGCVTFQ